MGARVHGSPVFRVRFRRSDVDGVDLCCVAAGSAATAEAFVRRIYAGRVTEVLGTSRERRAG